MVYLIHHISFYLAAGLVVRVKNFKVFHYQMGRKIIVIFADLC